MQISNVHVGRDGDGRSDVVNGRCGVESVCSGIEQVEDSSCDEGDDDDADCREDGTNGGLVEIAICDCCEETIDNVGNGDDGDGGLLQNAANAAEYEEDAMEARHVEIVVMARRQASVTRGAGVIFGTILDLILSVSEIRKVEQRDDDTANEASTWEQDEGDSVMETIDEQWTHIDASRSRQVEGDNV